MAQSILILIVYYKNTELCSAAIVRAVNKNRKQNRIKKKIIENGN